MSSHATPPTDRPTRVALASSLASRLGVDRGVTEQYLFLLTLPPWERLARGLNRGRLMRKRPR